MDDKQNKCLGICQTLFNFIVKRLTVQAHKKSTLGNPTNHGKVDTKSGQTVPPKAHGTSSAKVELEKINSSERSNPSSSSSLRSLLESEQEKDDEEAMPTQGVAEVERAEEDSAAQPKAPKKMVSINDRVEDMHEAMKKRRKSKSFDKSNSFMSGEDESQPLRSILKAPSNLDEKSDVLVNPNGS